MTDRDGWRKSSYSAQTADCVEVAAALGAVRDSKNPAGPMLHGNVTALVVAVKAGQLG